MFLSVSMPVYNAAQYLNDCIQSVIEQTEEDYELILVDDGSTDSSLDICYKWAALFPNKIRVISKGNSGSLLTRRVCLKESNGEYLYVMDADDCLIDKDAFKIIKRIIEINDCDLVFFNCTTNRATGEKFYDIPFEDGTIFQGDLLKVIRRFYITGRGLKPLWNKVFHRSLVDWDIDYSPYDKVTNGTDAFQSLPIVSHAKKAYYLDKILYFYRIENNTNSIVHTFKPTIYYSARTNFIRMVDEAQKWNIDEKELNCVLSQYYMKLSSTAAYKVRLISENDNIDKVKYLREIGEDSVFNKYYSFSNSATLPRKIINLFLHLGKYKLLIALIR